MPGTALLPGEAQPEEALERPVEAVKKIMPLVQRVFSSGMVALKTQKWFSMASDWEPNTSTN